VRALGLREAATRRSMAGLASLLVIGGAQFFLGLFVLT
jgi:hypothetical protein